MEANACTKPKRGGSRDWSSCGSSQQSNSDKSSTALNRTDSQFHELEEAAAACVVARAAAACDSQPGPLTATAVAAAAAGLQLQQGVSPDEPGSSGRTDKLPSALAGANSVLQDLHPSLLSVVIAKSTTRKGKGGRQPAADPRLDPCVDPKKARRILANRQSAARSKLKQKLVMEGLKAKHDVLVCQKQELAKQLRSLRTALKAVEAENGRLEAVVQGAQPMEHQALPQVHSGGRCTPTPQMPAMGSPAGKLPGLHESGPMDVSPAFYLQQQHDQWMGRLCC